MGSLLRKMGCNFESRDEAGRTPLMTAIWLSNYEIAQFMLEAIAVSPNAVDFQVALGIYVYAFFGTMTVIQLGGLETVERKISVK